jgi:hypothetical protein
MNCHIVASLLGIIFQLLGAGYLVWQSRFTSNKLAKYKSNITYDNFSAAIDDLAHEVSGQFKQQMRGFILIVAGSVLLFYGAWPA